MKIALIAGGSSDEHDISRRSAANVKQSINNHEILSVTINESLDQWRIEKETLTPAQALHFLKNNVDVALPMLHGPFGEDGVIQGALETAEIPYTGSGVAASALAMDKFAASLVAHAAGLAMPRTVAVHRKQPTNKLDIKFPVIVKPRTGGSTVGVSICDNSQQLSRAVNDSSYDDLIIQQLITGREFTCGVVERADGQLHPLPPSEVIMDGLFDYDAKYNENSSAQEITPANIDDSLQNSIQSAATMAHRALGCSGITRSDFIADADDQLFFIELNTCPGMTARSFIPAQLQAAKLDIGEILLEQGRIELNQ